MCIEDFSVAESVVVSLPPKHKKDITICDVPNGKILVRKGMQGRTPSLLKSYRKSKNFLFLGLSAVGFFAKSEKTQKKEELLRKKKKLEKKNPGFGKKGQ